MDSRSEVMLEIGKIVGTHGLRGDLKVRPHTGDPGVLLDADQVTLHLPSGEELTLEPIRQSLHKGQVLLRFEGYESIDQVEPMVGGKVLLAEDMLPELEDGEFHWAQLKGLQVVDQEKGVIGKLHQMFTTAAHDTYVVTGPFGEVLIPAVAQFIQEVDLDERVMKVDLPYGLIPGEE